MMIYALNARLVRIEESIHSSFYTIIKKDVWIWVTAEKVSTWFVAKILRLNMKSPTMIEPISKTTRITTLSLKKIQRLQTF